MIRYGLWWGGCSYGRENHLRREQFNSLAQAKQAFQDRRDNADRFTPAVGLDSTLELWDHPHDDSGYMVLSFGPRGGIKVEQ